MVKAVTKTVYRTSDDKIFESSIDAATHEARGILMDLCEKNMILSRAAKDNVEIIIDIILTNPAMVHDALAPIIYGVPKARDE